MNTFINTLFTQSEIKQLSCLYNESIQQFYYEVEINPFAVPFYDDITIFVNNKFEGLTDKLSKEIVNEIINNFI